MKPVYDLIKEQPLPFKEHCLYLWRLGLLLVIHPSLWFLYWTSKRRADIKSPITFLDLMKIHFGHEEEQLAHLNPLKPREISLFLRETQGRYLIEAQDLS
jgi:hypothetical protein